MEKLVKQLKAAWVALDVVTFLFMQAVGQAERKQATAMFMGNVAQQRPASTPSKERSLSPPAEDQSRHPGRFFEREVEGSEEDEEYVPPSGKRSVKPQPVAAEAAAATAAFSYFQLNNVLLLAPPITMMPASLTTEPTAAAPSLAAIAKTVSQACLACVIHVHAKK